MFITNTFDRGVRTAYDNLYYETGIDDQTCASFEEFSGARNNQEADIAASVLVLHGERKKDFPKLIGAKNGVKEIYCGERVHNVVHT